MGYYDEAEPSFAQRFGDWERVPQQATDALGRPLVLNAQGRSMSDAFEAFGMPMYAKITRDTLAMKEAEQARKAAAERAQAGGSLEGTPASFAERFGDWESLPQQGADTFYRPRVTDAAGRPMSDFYERLYRSARSVEDAGATEAAERERKAAAERARASWDVDGPDIAKSGGIGLVKGGIGIAGAGGDAWSFIDSGLARAGLSEGQRGLVRSVLAATPFGFPLRGPASKDIQSKVEEYTGEFYKPKTRVGRYTQNVGEFVPAAALPGGWLRNLVKYALLPGIASEAAGEATKDTAWEPYARGGAALATGLGAAALRWPRIRTTQRGDAPDTPGLVPEGGPTAQSTVPEAKSVPSNYLKLYDLPDVPQAPITALYPLERFPHGPPRDAQGRITHTPQGVEIKPDDIVIGRKFVSGPDQGIPPDQVDRFIRMATGQFPIERPGSVMGNKMGAYSKRREPGYYPDGYRRRVEVNAELTPQDRMRTLLHEGAGHGVADTGGGGTAIINGMPFGIMEAGPPSPKVRAQLDHLFDAMHNGKRPQDYGYSNPELALMEFWAEAMRGAVTNPNYVKKHAPDVYAIAQHVVNNHPVLSRYFKLNTVVPPIAGGGALAAGALAPERSEAAEPRPSAALSGGDFAEIFGGSRKRPQSG